MKARERWACLTCPAGWEAEKEDADLSLDSGRGEIILDGRRYPLCIPGEGGKKKMEPYCYYCQIAGRKIGHKASWTGLQPKWCPRLEEE